MYYHYSPGIPQKPASTLGLLLNAVVLFTSGMSVARVIQIEADLANWTWIVGLTCGIMVIFYLLVVMSEYHSRRKQIPSFPADVVFTQATRGLAAYAASATLFLVNATVTYATSAPYSAIYLNNIVLIIFMSAFYLIAESLFDFTAKGNEDRRIADAERRGSLTT